eukprot:6068642-Pleurochrysis_carterae.AAC.1
MVPTPIAQATPSSAGIPTQTRHPLSPSSQTARTTEKDEGYTPRSLQHGLQPAAWPAVSSSHKHLH